MVHVQTLDTEGQARFSLGSLSNGRHRITATYDGSAIDSGSIGMVLLIVD
jgi:hypothetical protein